MGKYIGSPWGFVRGKIGDAVGGAWKGIDWVRVRVLPTQRGTLSLYRQLKDGLLPPERFSYPQMNIRRVITQVLGYVGRYNMSTWIYPIWEALCTKRGWTMTGINAFVKRNAALLLTTMDRTLEFDPTTNTPDLAQMIVSDGDLEAGRGFSATYDPLTGVLATVWDGDSYTNGSANDTAYLMVAKKPMLESIGRDGTWYPALFMYGPYTPVIIVTRSNEALNQTLPIGLDPADLTAYLFFRDAENIIGFSPSVGSQVVAGP